MSKVCAKCGSIIEDNAKFCDECGAPVIESSAETQFQKINMYSQEKNNSSHMSRKSNTDANNTHSGKQTTANAYSAVEKKTKTGKKAIGVISLIFGILSIITLGGWIIPEIVAIICGLCSKDESGKRTKAGNAGFVCGIIGIVLIVIVIVLALLI